jgi:hypothetical protein
MDADLSVELGPPTDEAVLEIPWDSGVPDGPRFLDLKRQPELLRNVVEANQYPELGSFLQSLNSEKSSLATAKCDVWSSDYLDEADQGFFRGPGWKVVSYVDLIFSEANAASRFSFPAHEQLARSLAELLKKAPEMPARCEAMVRRCYFHQPNAGAESTAGFYITAYLWGYGKDETHARRQWHIALQLTSNALGQSSRGARRMKTNSRGSRARPT